MTKTTDKLMIQTTIINSAVQKITEAANQHCGFIYLNERYLRQLFSNAKNIDLIAAADKFVRGLEKHAGHTCPAPEAYDRALQWLEAHCDNAI